MTAVGLRDFRRAVADYPRASIALVPAALADARASIAASALLLLGERHGVAETPALIDALVRKLGLRGIGLEWSHDELGSAVDEFMSRGRFAFEQLWQLPAESEFFAGDGRITAGHFALLHRLHDDRLLDQVVLFDRLDPVPMNDHWSVRDREMAARLLAEWQRDVPLVAVAGADHVRLSAPDGTPMAGHVVEVVPHAGRAVVRVQRSGAPSSSPPAEPLSAPAPIEFVLADATPAFVPAPSP